MNHLKDLKPDVKPNLDLISWSPSKANEVVAAWQRNFTEKLYNHKWNDEVFLFFHALLLQTILGGRNFCENFAEKKYTLGSSTGSHIN